MQIIFHIDLNAFYASAEISVDPALAGKPLIISGNNRRSNCINCILRSKSLWHSFSDAII